MIAPIRADGKPQGRQKGRKRNSLTARAGH